MNDALTGEPYTTLKDATLEKRRGLLEDSSADGPTPYPGRDRYHQLRQAGVSVTAAAKAVGVSRGAGHKWDKQLRNPGSISPLRPARRVMSCKQDMDTITDYQTSSRFLSVLERERIKDLQQTRASLSSTLSGSKDSKLAYKWATPQGPKPGPAFEKRLQLAHRVRLAIADAENEAIARGWFVGGNPFLDEDTPVTALREVRHKEVVHTLSAFLEDRQDI